VVNELPIVNACSAMLEPGRSGKKEIPKRTE
jgi:hypothetical protein